MLPKYRIRCNLRRKKKSGAAGGRPAKASDTVYNCDTQKGKNHAVLPLRLMANPTYAEGHSQRLVVKQACRAVRHGISGHLTPEMNSGYTHFREAADFVSTILEQPGFNFFFRYYSFFRSAMGFAY